MQRPTSVTVFGILNMIFGGLGLVCMPFSVLGMLMTNNPNDPFAQIIHANPSFRYWMIASLPLQLASSLMLLAAGIGLYQMKPWGRKLSMAYGIYALVLGVIGVAMNLLFLVGPMMEQMNRGGADSAAAMGGVIGGMCGGIIAFIYPILLLVFMMRPNVVQAFNQAAAPQFPTSYPPQQ